MPTYSRRRKSIRRPKRKKSIRRRRSRRLRYGGRPLGKMSDLEKMCHTKNKERRRASATPLSRTQTTLRAEAGLPLRASFTRTGSDTREQALLDRRCRQDPALAAAHCRLAAAKVMDAPPRSAAECARQARALRVNRMVQEPSVRACISEDLQPDIGHHISSSRRGVPWGNVTLIIRSRHSTISARAITIPNISKYTTIGTIKETISRMWSQHMPPGRYREPAPEEMILKIPSRALCFTPETTLHDIGIYDRPEPWTMILSYTPNYISRYFLGDQLHAQVHGRTRT